MTAILFKREISRHGKQLMCRWRWHPFADLNRSLCAFHAMCFRQMKWLCLFSLLYTTFVKFNNAFYNLTNLYDYEYCTQLNWILSLLPGWWTYWLWWCQICYQKFCFDWTVARCLCTWVALWWLTRMLMKANPMQMLFRYRQEAIES